MGGRGSGRHFHVGASATTDDYLKLDVRRLSQERLLVPGNSFGWNWLRRGKKIASINVEVQKSRIILEYRQRRGEGEWRKERYPVRLAWTPCNLGGQRPWFLCPNEGCGHRVAILYGGAIFACRHCYKLAYGSQRESVMDRAARRADKIRDRMGWEPGILNGKGSKPKGMHWRTYRRLCAEHDALLEAAGIWQMIGFREELMEAGRQRR